MDWQTKLRREGIRHHFDDFDLVYHPSIRPAVPPEYLVLGLVGLTFRLRKRPDGRHVYVTVLDVAGVLRIGRRIGLGEAESLALIDSHERIHVALQLEGVAEDVEESHSRFADAVWLSLRHPKAETYVKTGPWGLVRAVGPDLWGALHEGPRLVLASGSPRRARLLKDAGLDFDVMPTHADETPPADCLPEAAVLAVARRKAMAAKVDEETFVLAADTEVVLDGRIFGKPRDAADARRMLAELSGRTHRVITAVVVRAPDGRTLDAVEIAHVTFHDVTAEDIDAYVATGEPLDKAGAYGFQTAGGKFVKDIRGDATTVIGLPVKRALTLLREAGFPMRQPL